MRTGRSMSFALFVLAFVFVCASVLRVASAEDQPVNMRYGQVVVADVGDLSGRVIYPDGKTALPKAVVRVWSVQDAKFVQEVLTDKEGAYTVKNLTPGRYIVVFGDRVVVDLRVQKAPKAAVQKLDVICPHGKTVFAQMAMERKAAVLTTMGAAEEGEKAGGGLLKTVVVGAGGTATAVGIVAAIRNAQDDHHHDDDDKDVISA